MISKTKDWWKKSVVYQIYPRSFKDSNGDGIGDIQGIIQKLGYLKNLGVDVIWLSPIYDSPQEDNGYDIRNYQTIFSEYGTMADFEQLLESAHQHGLKMIMDLVVNHTSDEHPWFVESRKSKDTPYRDYYIWRDGKGGLPPTNWRSFFSGSTWQFDETTNQYYLHIFAAKQPDLNWENEQLRTEIYQMMKFWLDKGIDGFRMDVINFISKDQRFPDGIVVNSQMDADGSPFFINGPRVHEFMQEMNLEVLSKYDVMTVGETPNASPSDAKQFTNPANQELNMLFHFDHVGMDCHGGDKWNLKPLQLKELKENFEMWQKQLHGVGWNSLYWNNHDQPRIVSRFGDDGEYREKSAKMLATCLHCMQGTPYIYQGEEIGMINVQFQSLSDYRDIETLNMFQEKKALGWSEDRIMEAIHAKGRDNARTPMQWDRTAAGGFTTGEPWIKVNPCYPDIHVEAALADKNSIFYYYQKLIQLRKTLEIITAGTFELLFREDSNIFAYCREMKNERLIVLCNFSKASVSLSDQELLAKLKGAAVLLSNDEEIMVEGQLVLAPYAAFVYHIKNI